MRTNAKWSYFSRANRVRLYTTTKWTLPYGAAVLEKTLKLAAVRRLRALAFFVEALETS